MTEFKIEQIKKRKCKKRIIQKGYAGKTLNIDLSRSEITIKKVTPKIKKIFTGGKGYDLWHLWENIKNVRSEGGTVKWNDPENTICYASGPLGGTPGYPGSGKSIFTAISPLTGSVVDSNVGGFIGPYTKFSGFDAVSVKGKSEDDVVILIDGVEGSVKLFKTSGLPDDSYKLSGILTDYFGEGKPHNISVVSTGPGARFTRMGCLNVSFYYPKRKRLKLKQAGRGGIGTVFADKGIKAVVARCNLVKISTNNPADPKALKKVIKEYNLEIEELDEKQNQMSKVGTTHLVPIMNEYDLLPVKNFQFGSHEDAEKIGPEAYRCKFDEGSGSCWVGCKLACAHCIENFTLTSGPYFSQKVSVDGPEYETIAGTGSNLGIFDPNFVAEMNFYCDTYGLDTISVGVSIGFAMECFERSIIDKGITGMDLSFGNKASALRLLHQMAEGWGFGMLAGQGVRRMKNVFASVYGADINFLNDIGMEAKGLEFSMYITKESLAQQGGYGLALKGPQHDEAWLIFEDMVRHNLLTFADKAEALAWFPYWRTWFGLMGLCKLPWNDVDPAGNDLNPQKPLTLENARAKMPKHVAWYADYFNAITGMNIKAKELLLMSERVYNFQRILALKLGYGYRKHDSIPYRAMGPVTEEEYLSRENMYNEQLAEIYFPAIYYLSTEEKIAMLRKHKEAEYEKLKDAVYERRGWTPDGIPTVATVKRLGIDFPEVLDLLKQHKVEC